MRLGSVRRSKLYYLRSRRGKSARITERKGDISKKATKVSEAKSDETEAPQET